MARAAVLFLVAAGPLSLRAAAPDSAGQLRSVSEEYFESLLHLYPNFASECGDYRFNDSWANDISEEHRTRRVALWERNLAALKKLKRDQLSSSEQLTYDLLKQELEFELEALDYPDQLLPVGNMQDVPTEFAVYGSGLGPHPFRTVKDYDDFLGRIDGFVEWADTSILSMAKGIPLGITQPRITIENSVAQLTNHFVEEITNSIFFQPIQRMPAEFPAAERARLSQAYEEAIRGKLLPAYQRLAAYLQTEYLPACRQRVGFSEVARGKEWYRFLVRRYTTTTLSPDEIFEIGRKEVVRIQGEMEQLKVREGFSGDFAAFAQKLEAKATMYATADEILSAYRGLNDRIAPGMAKLFARQPKSLFEVRPVEVYREKTAAHQYMPASPDGSRPGVFYLNTGELKDGPMRVSVALFLHEAVPGHHYEISRRFESADLPRFRRFARYNAYTEGWALYAEGLGHALGVYADAHQVLQRLVMEMWRARRLVVDVGLHVKGWSREEAIAYMLETPTIPRRRAVLEVDRYIGWPGQALGYKIGELEILRLRAEAERTLGAGFDARRFHEEILRDGPMPLDLLGKKVESWIHEEKTRVQR